MFLLVTINWKVKIKGRSNIFLALNINGDLMQLQNILHYCKA